MSISPSRASADNIQDCVVIGAGFSGLSAAEALLKKDVSVTLLEARDRVGGRARTEVVGENWLDYGGQWLGPGHTGMYEYAKRYNKAIWPMYLKGRHTTWLNGEKKHHRLPFPTTLPWRALVNLLTATLRFEWMALRVSKTAPWQASKAKEWDAISLEQWMQGHLTQPAAYAVFKVAAESVLAKHPADVSLLQALFYFRSSRSFMYATASKGGAQQDRVDGGMQPLAEALVADLNAKGLNLQLNQAVTSITQTQTALCVKTTDGEFLARSVIIATPPILAREINIEPALPTHTQQMMDALTPGCAIKCFAIYERPFWRDEGLSGSLVSDQGPVHVCFDVTPPDSTRGVLMGFIEGRDGMDWTDADPAERQATVLAQFADYFGPAAAEPLEYADHSWLNDEWTRGCYGGTAGLNALSRWGDGLRQVHNGVIWAGTETATEFNGYFEGAVRAGRRAAAQATDHIAAAQ